MSLNNQIQELEKRVTYLEEQVEKQEERITQLERLALGLEDE